MKKLKIISALACMSVMLCSCSILEGILSPDSNNTNISSKVSTDGLVLSHRNGVVQDDDVIEIETYYDYYFTATIDGKEAVIKSIDVEDKSVIFAHSRSVYPRKEGETKATIVCGTSSSDKTYTRTFTLKSIYHGELESIYVANGSDGIKLDSSNNVSFTGKVYAIYGNGTYKYVAKDSLLKTKVEDGKDDNHKKVTLSYSFNNKTVEASYNVPITNSNPIERTTLKQGFDEYYQYGYNNIRGHVKNSGTANVLAIPVWFTDSSKYISDKTVDFNGKNQKEQIIEDMNEALFGDPIRQYDYSLKKYYEEESFGKIKISGKVTDWYPSTYSSELDYFSNVDYREGLLKGAYDWYTSSNPEDTTKYDAVLLLYGSNIYGNQKSHGAFETRMSTTYNGISDYIFASSLSIYNISAYDENITAVPDLSDCVNNDSLAPYSIIHEFAHTLGAIDVYSDSRVTGTSAAPAGVYSMQANDYGGHDPFHMMAFNYASPYVLDASKDYGSDTITLTFNDLHSSGDLVVLSPKWNDYDSPFDEYLVLELYAQSGINYAFNNTRKIESGIRLYHVDSRLFDLKNYDFTSDATTPYTAIPFNNSTGVSYGPYVSYPVLNNYQDYHLLHLIRKLDTDSKGNKIDFNTSDYGREDMWFRKGDKFKMSDFASQFLNEGKFDDEESVVGWKFEVTDLIVNENNGASATVRFTKDK